MSTQSIPPISHHEYICIIQCTINLHCSWLMVVTKIKCMHTINVNAICEYQTPAISTIVAVDTLCWRCTCSYNLQVAKQFTHADTANRPANSTRSYHLLVWPERSTRARNLAITLVRVSFVSQSVKIRAKLFIILSNTCRYWTYNISKYYSDSRKQCKVLVEVAYISTNLSKAKRSMKYISYSQKIWQELNLADWTQHLIRVHLP